MSGATIADFECSIPGITLEYIRELYSSIPLGKPITIRIRGCQEDLDYFLLEASKWDPNNLYYEDIEWKIVEVLDHTRDWIENDTHVLENNGGNVVFTILHGCYQDQVESILLNY